MRRQRRVSILVTFLLLCPGAASAEVLDVEGLLFEEPISGQINLTQDVAFVSLGESWVGEGKRGAGGWWVELDFVGSEGLVDGLEGRANADRVITLRLANRRPLEGKLLEGGQVVGRLTETQGAPPDDWAQKRLAAWQQLRIRRPGEGVLATVARVNQHFNQLQFTTDADAWGREDYWATPREFVERGQGDCEDFAIAKYFALIELGVSPNRMWLIYGTDLTKPQAHMVLGVDLEANGDPIVLDNLRGKGLRALSKRHDFAPTLNFHSGGQLLISREPGNRQPVGSTRGLLSRWRGVLEQRSRSSDAPGKVPDRALGD